MNPESAILFLCFELVVGVLTSYFISRYTDKIPYTVLLFLEGIIIAVVHNFTVNDINNSLLESILQWEHIFPNLMLFVFIPPLLFSECMNLNLHYVKKVICSSMLLAIPGAAFNAWLIACYIYGSMYYYNFTFTFCWILGSILCATDPVSIVALMKNHTSTSSQMILTYLVIGESLLNDGIALVLYEICSKQIEDENMNRISFIVLYFVKVLICSPLIGAAFGYGAVLLLKVIDRRIFSDDVVSQIIITVSTAYLSFYIAQYNAGVSGVISCCSAGVMIATSAPTVILNQESMEILWSVLEWIGNTLIFLLSGLVVGSKAFVRMEAIDLLYIVILYLGINAIRILILIICTPIIKLEIKDFTIQNTFFVSFAGLRGPMCLVLVLLLQSNAIVKNNNSSNKHSHEYFTFSSESINKASILLCGVVTLTNLINGILSEFVLYSLGIIKKDIEEYEDIVMHYAAKRIKKSCLKLLKELINDMPVYDLEMIHKTCSIFEDFDFHEIQEELLTPKLETNSVDNDEYQVHYDSSFLSVPIDTSYMDKSDIESNPSPQRVPLDLYSNKSTPGTPDATKIKKLNTPYSVLRDLSSALDEDLIIKIRNVYLNYVRTNYLMQISSGRLPRGSGASLVLLNSIEVGLETVHVPGHQDWDAVFAHLNAVTIYDNTYLNKLASFSTFLSSLLNSLKVSHDYEKIRICTSFILAHTNAMNKIPTYLGEHEYIDTPEEALVVKESREIIDSAKKVLSSMNQSVLKEEISILISRSILFNQEDIINHYVEEGILTQKEGSILSKDIPNDFKKMSGFRLFNCCNEWNKIFQRFLLNKK